MGNCNGVKWLGIEMLLIALVPDGYGPEGERPVRAAASPRQRSLGRFMGALLEANEAVTDVVALDEVGWSRRMEAAVTGRRTP